MINNINIANKNIIQISDILSSNQISIKEKNRKNTQSVHIFQKNFEKAYLNDLTEQTKTIPVLYTNNLNTNSQQLSGTNTFKESQADYNNANKNNTNPSLHNSSININLSERMSKIEEKMNKINQKLNNVNLDSRIKSVNDISALDESKIIKNKSFLSFNNNY